jgi:hypothetical protein
MFFQKPVSLIAAGIAKQAARFRLVDVATLVFFEGERFQGIKRQIVPA